MAEIAIRLDGCVLAAQTVGDLDADEAENEVFRIDVLSVDGQSPGMAPGERQPERSPVAAFRPALLRRAYRCRFVRAGVPRSAGGQPGLIEIDPAALQQAALAGQFDGKAVFVDHASSHGPAAGLTHPSLHDLVGVTAGASWNAAEQCVEGVIRLYSGAAALAGLLDELLAEGKEAPDVGLSIVFWPVFARRQAASGPRRITGIRHVESVDLVFEPAADGRVLQALSAKRVNQPNNVEAPGSHAIARSEATKQAPPGQAIDSKAHHPGSGVATAGSPLFSKENEGLRSGVRADKLNTGGEIMDEYQTNPGSGKDAPGSISPGDQYGTAVPGFEPVADPAAVAALDSLIRLWLDVQACSAADNLVNASNLPEASKKRLLRHGYATPQEVGEAIQAERQYLAALTEENVVQIGGRAPRGGSVQVGMDGLERLSLALEALLAGRSPSSLSAAGQNIPPLSGIREAYMLLSGDYDLTGVFYPERVSLANVNSSTMAGLVANALNKSVINAFQLYPRWWERFVTIEDFSNLQQVKWITLGGVGELPTVGEGASYTELTWDDQTETTSFVKKGGYLGITLEAIDKDDTRKVQAAPRALAQAAWLTLAKSVSAIFTQASGTGPTMSDSVVLFHSSHANLGSTALSMASFAAARTAMRKQTELNSAERLGALTAPKFLLVPPDLEITALQIMGSDLDYSYALSNATAAPVNVLGDDGNTRGGRLAVARERVVVIDLWTDTNDWAAVADPLLYPSIGLGFRYGRTPEIFSVASPTAGLMFSNDVMPIKVRFFYAVGPTDWRGLYKANVS